MNGPYLPAGSCAFIMNWNCSDIAVAKGTSAKNDFFCHNKALNPLLADELFECVRPLCGVGTSGLMDNNFFIFFLKEKCFVLRIFRYFFFW